MTTTTTAEEKGTGGRRVQFNDQVETVASPNTYSDNDEENQAAVAESAVTVKSRSKGRPERTSRRSWSPMRRSRKHPRNDSASQNSLSHNSSYEESGSLASGAPSLQPAATKSQSKTNANATTTATATTTNNNKTRTSSPRRRSWFGNGAANRQNSSNNNNNNNSNSNNNASSKTQRGRQSTAPAPAPPPPLEEVALQRETEKLLRTLLSGGNFTGRPVNADTMQEAYLHALYLQDEVATLREKYKKASPKELKEAQAKVKQLQMELVAAQKAASQLVASNQQYEKQIEVLAEQLEMAQSRVEIMEQKVSESEKEAEAAAAAAAANNNGDGGATAAAAAAADEKALKELSNLREQLSNAKRAMVELQYENDNLKKTVRLQEKEIMLDNDGDSMIGDSMIGGGGGGPEETNSLYSSFELQLNLQKDLARVTARVHRLEQEKAAYQEKQQKMEEILKQVEDLEHEKDKLMQENSSLRLQLECSKAETARAMEAANSAPSHKDMVLSSSQLATATTIIGRLTEECKTLSHREKELKDQIKRLEKKNKNQKEIFSTALEIKQVELKIYEQESKAYARKVEELNQTIDDLHFHQQHTTTTAEVIPVPPTPPPEDPEVLEGLRNQLLETEDKLRICESMNQDLEDQIEELQTELEERKNRVAELEELLRIQKEKVKSQIEHETAELSQKLTRLTCLMDGKEEELRKLKDELEDERKESEYRTQVRVNELTEQLNDYEMSLEEREERIQELEEKVNQQEELLEKLKISPRSVNGFHDDASHGETSKLESLRRKMGTYENLMREKMNRIHDIDRRTSYDEQPIRSPSNDESSGREESPPPMMVFATPVSDTRVIEMEASLRASDEQIEELRAQLVDAQLRLTQVQEAAEEAADERFKDMEASLMRSEERIRDLKQQLAESHQRLDLAQQAPNVEKREMEVQVDFVSPEQERDRARLEEMTKSLQQSNAEADLLREQIAQTEAKLAEMQAEHNNLSREESAVSSEDLAMMTALEEELEEFRQKYDDECDKRHTLSMKVEALEAEKEEALQKLQHAECEILEKQNNIDELTKEIEETKARLVDSHRHMRKNSLVPQGRVASLEAELHDAREQLKEADIKIEMLEQFIEEETASHNASPLGSGPPMSGLQAQADIRKKDEELRLLRAEVERTNKELLRNKERVENLEMERNYSTAKLKELSSIVKTKAGSETEVQLYNKCIECAELSADKDDLSNKLRVSEATVKRLQQEISLTKKMVTDISESWDSAATADQNIVRLKKEHGESIARATSLSIELAESQMRINELEDRLSTTERANKAYAEELNSRPGILRAIAGSASRSHSAPGSRPGSRQSSPERQKDNSEIRRLKQRIALLEDQNAAYEASLSAFSSLHENMQRSSNK